MGQIKLTIDGREITTTAGKTILEAALDNGIEIPTFCWHPKLKSIGACRVCLVEVEKWPKLQVSCATLAADGMIIHANNPRVVKARQAVIEFILLNHPLDCPTCDKGGECPLQNITYHYGLDFARTQEPRQRFIVDENSTFDDLPIGPEIIRNQNRCIHCFRCVRIVDEVCEEDDLGAYERGHGTEILPPPNREIRNLYSGNVVEYCPVGALTNRDWRYKVRVWLTRQKKSVCGFCPDGCNLTLWTARDRVFRATSRRNDDVDEGFICDIGRYGYQFAHHADRLEAPLIKRGGELVECSWQEAYSAIAAKLKSVKEKLGPQGIAALVGEDGTNEDFYVIGKFMRSVVGSNSIDHRLHRKTKLTHSQQLARLGVIGSDMSFADLEKCDLAVILGSDLHTENPITALRLLKAKRYNDAKLVTIGPTPTRLSRSGQELVHRPNTEIALLTALTRLVLQEKLVDFGAAGLDDSGVERYLNDTDGFDIRDVANDAGIPESELRSLARQIAGAKRAVFITGAYVALHYQRDTILTALYNLAFVTGHLKNEPKCIIVQRIGGNNRGSYLFGMRPDRLPFGNSMSEKDALAMLWPGGVPDRTGFDTIDILREIDESRIEMTFVVAADPVRTYPDRSYIHATMSKLDFLVVVDLYLTETAKLADVVLPMASHMESPGSFCNWEGRVQVFEQAIKPIGSSKPAWLVFSDLSAAAGCGFDYSRAEQVFDEFAKLLPQSGLSLGSLPQGGLRVPSRKRLDRSAGLQQVSFKPPELDGAHKYVLLTGNGDHHIGVERTIRTESLSRFMDEPYVGLSVRTATDLALSEGDLVRVENKSGKIIGKVKYVERLRDDCVWIPDNFPEMQANVLKNRSFDIDMVSLVKV